MKFFVIATTLIVALLPIAVALAIVTLDRRRDPRLKRKLPIGAKVLRAPGDSLRLRLDAISSDVDSGLIGLGLVGPVAVACWAILRMDWSAVRLGAIDFILLGAYLAGMAGLIRTVLKSVRLRRLYREGLLAERYTAQELNRLTAAGCAVFHDLPAEDFNIDHVVVGGGAVYAIETKSRRKADGPNGHRVRFDGERLHFPDSATNKPLEQADRNARWLARKLENTLGKSVPVVPVVALPGWFVESTREAATARVRVMPVGGRSAHFMIDARRPIDPNYRSMIGEAISMLYPTRELGDVA